MQLRKMTTQMSLEMKKPAKENIALAIIALLGIVIFVYFILHLSFIKTGLLETLLFTLLVALAQYYSLTLPQGGELTVSPALLIAGLVLFPLPNVLVIAVLGSLLAILPKKEKPDYAGVFFDISRFVLVLSLAAVFYHLVGGRLLLDKGTPQINLLSFDIVPLVVVSVVYFLADTTLEEIFLKIKQGQPFTSTWLGAVRLLSPIYVALASIGILIALIYRSVSKSGIGGIWTILVFVPLLALIEYSFELYLNMRKGYQSTIMALSTAIEAHDPSRLGHAERVEGLTIEVGKELGFFGEELELLGYAAALHDIGKLGIDEEPLDSVLQTAGVREKKEDHAELGAEILEEVDYLKSASDIVRKHHQAYVGERRSMELTHPLGARIIQAVDSYDHLTELRPPSECLPAAQAVENLRRDQGLVYDPKVVRALANVLQKKEKLG